ncbi:NUDIX domain-containing protein [Thorsellia anophelis]|uniref:ADP-ribose pyrophosphatase YjhB, NUDIX family n=1 Tax=Thorsellia anophelis DSM 18579 TaxID=1123402 RepID=A0A1H9Y3C8_9GAMM|nr:NUDIX domain-containing protein [Thorsellia anophelis]SES63303.1 ADP-ribose pyrophosphatase YjhB, NUDIX family [Thorsellia anophelis DSM 18579]
MITFDSDVYQGITLNSTDFPKEANEFNEAIKAVIATANQTHKRIIWVTLTHEQSILIPVLTQHGFIFHSCMEKELTLVLRLQKNVYVPFSPTHTVGLGGVVLRKKTNQDAEVLIIKEHLGSFYKLPGGHMELDETIELGVIRETYEETGIQTEFQSIVAIASKYPYQLGKSNIFLACSLTPINHEINIQDTGEIEDARWINLSDFFTCEEVSPFAKVLVTSTLKQTGLIINTTAFITQDNNDDKRELFTF